MTTTTAVTLSGVTKKYGTVQAVAGVDLTIRSGEVVALLGPNGAGKSTTIEMLIGLVRPDQGSVQVFGTTAVDAIAAGQVGVMLQSGGIIEDAKVGELLNLVAGLHRKPLPVNEALDRAGIADLADRKMKGLSGGQKQRVRFAMTIIPQPDLIVLDEPTTGMDVESRRDFWASMHAETARGRTVLFATHYLEEADAYADRVVLMRDGRITADGTAAQIKASVSGRTIRATVPGADLATLAALPGVRTVETRGDVVLLQCADSDDTLRYLLTNTSAHDIEVTSADLEDAVLAISAEQETLA
ncbi:ABC-2 type transport system ATP-binding protein [Kribbella orskensis]|uniref:ABC-2 type transport system ATP-binding protein n=1 Tax=Kribbella orskensis TaxID=2512216 RepID=A0ABY2BUM7_9ACTN|nr:MULTISPECIES: ABC transporter ATP-binding protein [Kribbella]TCN44477.1 ABC-2 type transport system ATP-binding protein [Kribbella sp. VKM Ac-2500]TCO31745.1 ABC-2 type transport system ATP-binding protein [Kribbella orskensis]